MYIWDSESAGSQPIAKDRANYTLDEKGNCAFIVADYETTYAHYGVVLFHGPDAEAVAEKWNEYVNTNEVNTNNLEPELQKFAEQML